MALTLPLVPVTGGLVDRFGTKHVVLLAQILQGIGLLGYLVVHNVPLLFVTALLDAIGQRLFWSTYIMSDIKTFCAFIREVLGETENDWRLCESRLWGRSVEYSEVDNEKKANNIGCRPCLSCSTNIIRYFAVCTLHEQCV